MQNGNPFRMFFIFPFPINIFLYSVSENPPGFTVYFSEWSFEPTHTLQANCLIRNDSSIGRYEIYMQFFINLCNISLAFFIWTTTSLDVSVDRWKSETMYWNTLQPQINSKKFQINAFWYGMEVIWFTYLLNLILLVAYF